MCAAFRLGLLTLLALLCLVVSGSKAATADYYTAGVAEFRPSYSGATSAQLLEEHLAAYLSLIRSAEATETDIIVFPEATLNTVLTLTKVPDSNSSSSLCSDEADVDVAPFLRQLACAAQETGKYLLINVKERVDCLDIESEHCSSRGYHIYNTNVVFDRSGRVVSRYRKWHLYLEPHTNRTAEPEFGVFETDFGVTFGHFVCFDILFYTPAQELIERLGVRNIIVTNMFNSELPFLTASQLQQGWAWGNQVNLLAAGASLPQGGISGSGIYAGQQGALARLMVGDEGVRQLLIARVPREPTGAAIADVPRPLPEQHGLLLFQEPKLNDFVTFPLPLSNGSTSQRLCHSDLCCDFELSTEVVGSPSYSYRLGAYVGLRSYQQVEFSAIRLCGIFACRNASVESCGQLSDASDLDGAATTFTALRISGEFAQRPRRLLMPSSLSAALYALQPSELSWHMEEQQARTFVELQLRQPQAQLLAFGIYGNYFDDASVDDGSASLSLSLSLSLLLPLWLLLWLFVDM